LLLSRKHAFIRGVPVRPAQGVIGCRRISGSLGGVKVEGAEPRVRRPPLRPRSWRAATSRTTSPAPWPDPRRRASLEGTGWRMGSEGAAGGGVFIGGTAAAAASPAQRRSRVGRSLRICIFHTEIIINVVLESSCISPFHFIHILYSDTNVYQYLF